MRRKIFTLVSSVVLSSTIYAQDINIQNGWQLLGATEDINVSKFDNNCVDFIWKYDNGNWKVHIANGQNYNYTGSTISSLNQGDGFWVKGNDVDGCNVNLGTYIPFTNSLIQNKTFYVISEDRFEKFQLDFNTTGYKFISEDENGSDNFTIDNNGVLNLGSDAPLWKLVSTSNSDYYQIQEVRATNGTWEDDTDWFDSVHSDNNISSFNNSITALKDFFLSNGLWETTITSDGTINKYSDKTKVDGKWWIEDNIFYFDYPDEDTGGLDSKAFKIENNKIYKATDAKYTHNARLYFNETKANEYYNTLINQ